ncbi:tyrosine-protein phosphatase non-receptor type 12-like isoform X2 [Mizuhopecten yessoensis]|uniref:tyrosine-protein phosphatase non-receptor type 12-like isoform X2 n=1 Tax=Mizuhopecten yessoensis TaxID=6573 RepID=UPI000B45BF4D|nr:tyrosine-protein phosphatase non-receptor type 12-like isoform X2 [Mizuhopecten yessoensis]
MDERAVQLQKNLSKFINHVDELTNEDDPAGNGFNREYRDLREIAAQHKENNTFSSTAGREPHNLRKNRYKDIIAYDYSRVKLQDTGEEGSDYINANLIQDPYDKDGYIASQGPLPNTVNDFWRMIMENRVKVVIMACKLIEGNKKKCAVYWPELVGDEEDYGNVTVTMTNESDMKEDCTVRVFEASYGDQSHQVTQYHYTGWPDHGIPEDRNVILAMVAKMRDIRHKDAEKAPILVHCSAGCGRTGTVCAIDYAWELLRGGKLTADFELKQIVEAMREQRQSMIQTPDQYEMAHLAVRDLFQKHLEIMEENIYMNYGDDIEEQDALDSLHMVTDSVSDSSTTRDDEEDIYSSAVKVLHDSLMDTVNMYTTNEEEIPGDILQPIVQTPSPKPPLPSTTKPAPPADKPGVPSKDISLTGNLNEDKKPDVKHKYQNVGVAATSYENMDLVVVKEEESSNISKSTPPQGSKFSPQIIKKMTPPLSPVKKQQTGPIFTGKQAEGSVITGKKSDSPVETDTSGTSFYSVASDEPSKPGSSGLQSGPTSAPSGPSWSPAPSKQKPKSVSTPPLATKFPKESVLQTQTIPSVKQTHVPSTGAKAPASNGKHVTKITVGGAMTSAPSNKTATETNNNLFSVATNSRDEKPSGPSTGGDVYSEVQRNNKESSSSIKRSSKRQSKPTQAPQQDVYSQVSRPTEIAFKGHILGGDGSYSDVVIGQPANVDDSLYSYVAVNPSSPDAAPPEVPNRRYLDPPQEPPPRGPVHTDTSNATLNKGASLTEQNRFKGLITKIKGGTTDHQYTDTSNIKGFHERIGQKPMGKREEPSRWKKIFKKVK